MTAPGQPETVLVKYLYQAITVDRSWDARWSEYKGLGEENTNLQPYRPSFPIIHEWTCQNTADEDNEDEIWITKAVEINDKRLRALVEKLLVVVPNLNLDGSVMKFDSRFKPFLFKWQEFKEVIETETDAALKDLLQNLHDIICPPVNCILQKVKRATATQSIDWETLLECCVPGKSILGMLNNRKQAYKVTGSGINWDELGRQYLFLDAKSHDYDGIRSGLRSTRFKITEFQGERSLKSLDTTPFKFLGNLDGVKSELVQRDKSFEFCLDLTIPYVDLDSSARRLVWKTFVNPGGKSSSSNFKENDFDTLFLISRPLHLYSDIVKIARVLAVQDGLEDEFFMAHIETVLKLRVKAAKTMGMKQSD